MFVPKVVVIEVVVRLASDLIMVDFARPVGEVAVLAEVFWKGKVSFGELGLDWGGVLIDARGEGPEATHDGSSGGVANRGCAGGIREEGAAGGEAVDIGGVGLFMAEATNPVIPVIDSDEEDVGFYFRGLYDGRENEGDEEAGHGFGVSGSIKGRLICVGSEHSE